MVDWYPKKGGTAQGPRIIGFALVISPTEGGLGVIGEF